MRKEIKRILPAIAAVLMAATLFSGCTADAPVTQAQSETVADTEELLLTIDELAAYNGNDGKPAYVAYDGVIYDVSDVPQWATGIHGGNMAGTDITEKLKTVSHGTTKLEGLAVVGKVVE